MRCVAAAFGTGACAGIILANRRIAVVLVFLNRWTHRSTVIWVLGVSKLPTTYLMFSPCLINKLAYVCRSACSPMPRRFARLRMAGNSRLYQLSGSMGVPSAVPNT